MGLKDANCHGFESVYQNYGQAGLVRTGGNYNLH